MSNIEDCPQEDLNIESRSQEDLNLEENLDPSQDELNSHQKLMSMFSMMMGGGMPGGGMMGGGMPGMMGGGMPGMMGGGMPGSKFSYEDDEEDNGPNIEHINDELNDDNMKNIFEKIDIITDTSNLIYDESCSITISTEQMKDELILVKNQIGDLNNQIGNLKNQLDSIYNLLLSIKLEKND